MIDEVQNKTILIVDYPGVQKAAIYGFVDLFDLSNRNAQHVSGPVLSAHLYTGILEVQSYDAIILPPNLTDARGTQDNPVIPFLQDQHEKGTLICSVCAGAFWLGQAGLLDHRPATTHWALGAELQETFPNAQVNTDPILIDDHDIITAGGLMAWVDLGLFLVEKWQGAQVMSQTARHLLVDTAPREQRSYRSFTPPLRHGDSAIVKVQHWLETRYGEDLHIKDLGTQAGQTPRTFLRRFKKATGLTPQNYLQELRIEKARGLLEQTNLPISEIGWRVGYQDPSAFSRLFKNTTGLNAGEYRKRFQMTRN